VAWPTTAAASSISLMVVVPVTLEEDTRFLRTSWVNGARQTVGCLSEARCDGSHMPPMPSCEASDVAM
jgi:hypothetical protein